MPWTSERLAVGLHYPPSVTAFTSLGVGMIEAPEELRNYELSGRRCWLAPNKTKYNELYQKIGNQKA